MLVRMYDPHPDSIMHALSRRDVRGPSDQIKLLIDSYDDRRSGYEFAVSRPASRSGARSSSRGRGWLYRFQLNCYIVVDPKKDIPKS